VLIGPLIVDPAAQGGVGKALVPAALEQARKLEKRKVKPVQSPSHLRSFALYTKCGFILREPLRLMQGEPQRDSRIATSDAAVRKVNDDLDISQCDRLCESMHGFPRQRELQRAKDQEFASMIERNGKDSGYAAGIRLFGHVLVKKI
jgi:hypothetical protein